MKKLTVKNIPYKNKYSLDETWVLCLAMWKWIVSQWKRGIHVDKLKEKWLFEFRPKEKYLESDCYFCDYVTNHSKVMICDRCPGVLVDKTFDCLNADYVFSYHPQKFYKKFVQLNKKRLQKKEKKNV